MTSGWIILARSKPDSDTHRRVRYAARDQEVDDDSGAAARCGAALLLLAALAPAPALAQGTPQPVFTELFAYDPADPWQLLEKWVISSHLDRQLRPLRVGVVEDPIGKTVGRVSVQEGDGLDGASEAMLQARRYICDTEGSRAAEVEAEPGGVVPSQRAEMQVRSDRATGAGELVKFGQPVWYRFSFKIAADWPQDVPAAGRQPCRTVIHQIKQDSFKGGKSCSASPFFKIEARPLGERMRFLSDCATKSPIVTTPTRSTCCSTTPASAAAASSPTAATSGRGLSTCAGAASTTGAVRAHLGPERPVSARLFRRVPTLAAPARRGSMRWKRDTGGRSTPPRRLHGSCWGRERNENRHSCGISRRFHGGDNDKQAYAQPTGQPAPITRSLAIGTLEPGTNLAKET